MKQIELTAAVLTPGEAVLEASLFKVELPGLWRGCVLCANERNAERNPGEAYIRVGWIDGGPRIRAPPSYAPVCEDCLER